MKIVAIAVKGMEFLYNSRTAHKVAQAKAQVVCDALNKVGYALKDDNSVWHVYDVNAYDDAFYYAETQRFSCGKNGTIKRIA